MSKIPEEWDLHYLNQQYSAMRWLAKQGLTPEEIRVLRWGAIDETDHTITLKKKFFFSRLDLKTGISSTIEDEHELKIKLTGTGHEWFFLKSKVPCPWVFTAHPPKTWRREGSKEALFPLEVVEKACRDLALTDTTSVLTKMNLFDNIEISKLNITKMKTTEQAEEAEVVN